MAFPEGPARITLFGSYLKEDKEYHGGPSQNLTSDAIHEAIHYDNPVADQFQIAPISAYSGSYLDMYRSSPFYDMIKPAGASNYDWPNAGMTDYSNQKMRSVIGDGILIQSASVQRFVKLEDVSERYYDSVLPDIRDIWTIDNANYRPRNVTIYDYFFAGAVKFNDTDQSTYSGIVANKKWLSSFPFEPKYSSLKRKPYVNFERPSLPYSLNEGYAYTGSEGGLAPMPIQPDVGGAIGYAGYSPKLSPFQAVRRKRGVGSTLSLNICMFSFGDGLSGSVMSTEFDPVSTLFKDCTAKRFQVRA